MNKHILPFLGSIVAFIIFSLSFTAHNNPIYAQCQGSGCSVYSCNSLGGFDDSPCVRNGGCCVVSGGGRTCVDARVPTPGATGPDAPVCPTPTTTPTGPVETPTIPSGPPTAPPTATVTPTTTHPTGTPGTACSVGYSASGNASQRCNNSDTFCTCPGGGFDCPLGTPGQCLAISTYVQCEYHQNSVATCNSDLDCQVICGGGDGNYYCNSNHRCSGGGSDANISPCTGGGMSCMTQEQCRDNITQCGRTNDLRCSDPNLVCCEPATCSRPTDKPISFELICNGTGVQTVFGCITNPATDIFGYVVRFASGMAGGISFLLILMGAFQIILSSGKPERLEAGRELVTSAVTGLLLILFSVFILSFLGVQVFKIPGFGP